MAYLHGTFKNKDNDTIEVQIRSTVGAEVINIGEDHNSKVFFSDDPIEITVECEDLFTPIIKKSCTINLLTSIFLGDKVFASNDEDVSVKIYKTPKDTENKQLIFSGFVEPNTYTQPYAYQLEEFTITCIDYLSTLQYKYLTDDRAYSNLISDSKIYTFNEYIEKIIDGFGSVVYDNSKMVDGKSALEVCGVSLNVFLGDSEDDLMNYEEILFELLQYLNLHIIQEGETFYIFDWKSIENNTLSVSNDFEVKKDMYSSDSTTLSMSEVYNQIQAKCNLEEIDDFLESPLESDALDSHYDRSQLFMTEYWSYGRGSTSLNAFENLINSPMTKDSESNDPNTDYNAWGARDWYVKWLYNPSWKLTYKNEDIESYMHNVNGTFLDQHMIMKILREKDYFPALLTLSTQKESMTWNKRKRTNSSLTSTNYLVISVNGNEVDTDEEATNIDNNNRDACGNTGLFTFNSGQSASFSPLDESITNYIVFNGKIALAPLMMKSVNVWLYSIVPPKNVTLQNQIDMFKHNDNGWAFLNTSMSPYKDDEAYYAQEFWASSRTNGVPKPQPNELWMYPFMGIDGYRQYQYNYSSDGSTEDTYDKIPILECELKIGDKYLVESTYNLNGGKPTYSWRTLNNCPFLKDDDGNDTTERKTTFTLGFDPNIGDFIIGKEYELANTVDGRISNEVGTAIPIRMSDALSGKVEFKIKGVVNISWNNITRRHPTLFRHTKWYDNYINTLSHTSAIWIKDFNVKIISDNGGKDIKSDSKDLIYLSDEQHRYIKKKDDIEFKINTIPTVEECADLGIKSSISNTNVINKDTNLGLVSITDSVGNNDRPEKIFIDQYWNYYNKPKVIVETDFFDKGYTFFDTFNFNGFGKMLTTSITQNLKYNNVHIVCRQI